MKRAVKKAFLIMGTASIAAIFFSAPVIAQQAEQSQQAPQAPKSQQPQKYAFIRPDYVFDKYDPYITAMDKVDAFEKAETEKLKKRMEDFQKKVDTAQKQAQLMNDEQIAQKRKELETEQTKLQKAQEDLLDRQNGSLVKKHRDLVQPIIDQFNTVLKQVGQKEGYDFVFNADMDNQVILYADPMFDISDIVLEELNKLPVPQTAAPATPASSGSSSAVPPAKTPAKAPVKK